MVNENNTRLLTQEDMKELHEKLRVLDTSWMETILERVKKEDSTFNKQRIYSIIRGSSYSQPHRRLFIKYAVPYLKELEGKQNEALSLLKSVK